MEEREEFADLFDTDSDQSDDETRYVEFFCYLHMSESCVVGLICIVLEFALAGSCSRKKKL